MKDIFAHQFAPLPSSLRSVGLGQIGESKTGIDTSDNHQNLCHNDKSFETDCISDMKNGIISA
jgi:hypothetical protein